MTEVMIPAAALIVMRDGLPERGVSMTAHAQVAALLGEILGDLSGVLSHEAILVDWAYQGAGMLRRAGRACDPLVVAHQEVRKAGRSLQVAQAALPAGGRT